MKKTEMIDQEKGKKSRKLILVLALLGIALVLLAIIGLTKFGTVFFFIPFWFWTVDKIIELTGANLWLARGFAALFVLPFFYLLKLIFSRKAEKRRTGWILLSVLTASLCFMMFFLSEDIYFSFKTGQAKKWYIVTPAGEYKFSDSPGYNTLWGTQYQKVTPEVIKKYVEQEGAGNKEIVLAIPRENTLEKTGSFSLSLEEEKIIKKELKKIANPYPVGQVEEEKFSDFLILLEKSGRLYKYEDFLRDIIKNQTDIAQELRRSSREAIYYLVKMGSVKSIPTLARAYVKVRSPYEREEIQKAIETIRARRR